jgi:microcystin-dependent protein
MSAEPLLGCIYGFGGNFAPRGYQLCAGQLLSIAQNTALFSILGTTFGGNGQTTFALPDLRGRMPIGQGQGPGLPNVVLGEQAGTNNVTLLSNQMPQHTHVITVFAAADGRPAADTPLNGVLDSTAGTNIYAAAPDPNTKMNAGMAVAALAGGSQPFNVQNPFLCINFIICTEGIFPSRN